jgi:hypothetical protein
MNGALTADAASSESCCGSQTSAEQAGSKSTCTSGGCGSQSAMTTGDKAAPATEASPATGVSRLWCPGRHEECAACLLRESAPHGEWAVRVSPVEPSHPCSFRQVKL